MQEEETMRLNLKNQKNLAINGSRCSDHILPDLHRTGSTNGHGMQQANLSRMAGVVKGEYPLAVDIRSKIPHGIVVEGDT